MVACQRKVQTIVVGTLNAQKCNLGLTDIDFFRVDIRDAPISIFGPDHRLPMTKTMFCLNLNLKK